MPTVQNHDCGPCQGWEGPQQGAAEKEEEGTEMTYQSFLENKIDIAPLSGIEVAKRLTDAGVKLRNFLN